MLIAFLIGFSIPLVARRLIKIFPEDAGTTLAYILTPRRTTLHPKSPHRKKWLHLYLRYMGLSVAYGVAAIISLYLLTNNFTTNVGWMGLFVWIMLSLMEIDRRVLLLPDVLTAPLLIFGFVFACSDASYITATDSAVGAMFGYFMPVLGAAIVYFFKKDSMGGGDIKILAALGAWMGLYYLAFAILLSLVIFIIIAIIRRSKIGPYGPAIVTASIITMYLMNTQFLAPYLDMINKY